MGENRYEHLDILKGLGIFLIVLGHLEPGEYILRFLYSFHLFVFYSCSGYIGLRYKHRNYLSILVNNSKRLLLPYFFWSFISQIVDYLLGDITIKEGI